MKILAMYLPQYHRIKENDEWWGEGYTEWVAVKNAKKYFAQHNQPRIPLNNNYYDLSKQDASTWKWQADLAKKYGIYGFCIYHYWLKTGEQLLEKPMEILLSHPEIDIRFCVDWANGTWCRTWYSTGEEILKEQIYGDEKEWINHFNYLLKFFKDKRYITVENKPMICIHSSYEIDLLERMRKVWDDLAKENGFDGVYLVAGNTGHPIDNRADSIDAYYNYEPGLTYTHKLSFWDKAPIAISRKVKGMLNNLCEKKRAELIVPSKLIYRNNMRPLWQNGKKCYLGTFPDYDDSPRRQYKGMIYKGRIKEFKDNLHLLKRTLEKNDRSDDFVFITAWNEWGEGAYLEPDEGNGYLYLEIIKEVMDEI
ncbi:hypothetical protein SAMN02910356_02041 [Selenomonas sp. GACV-9]|uniref:glycosyltransferase WbsX family protein n=1 Tax=Selenomonas sp. GACV-9 TaxID=3158782 RepID=UPI0008F1CB3A|nr:hypothetical protein SAMN02910356_02041 [Selenomonas ruminantium]